MAIEASANCRTVGASAAGEQGGGGAVGVVTAGVMVWGIVPVPFLLITHVKCIYTFDEHDGRKWRTARALVREALESGNAIISFQVIQETLNVITRKLAMPVNQDDANEFLDEVLLPLWKINLSRALYQRGLDLQYHYQFSFYDSLIVAAALDAGCKTLYSEDVQHGQHIERVTITNPFRP